MHSSDAIRWQVEFSEELSSTDLAPSPLALDDNVGCKAPSEFGLRAATLLDSVGLW